MATRRNRTSSTRTAETRARSVRRAAAPRSSAPMAIGGVVGAIAVVSIIAFLVGRSGDSGAKAAESGESAAEPAKSAPARQPSEPRKADKADRAGKTPDRAAPEIPDSVWTTVDEMYRDAKQKHDEGVKARSAGETSRYTTLIKESFDLIQAINTELEPYTSWLEEAVLESWAMPGVYVELERELGKIDKLGSRVQKLKQR